MPLPPLEAMKHTHKHHAVFKCAGCSEGSVPFKNRRCKFEKCNNEGTEKHKERKQWFCPFHYGFVVQHCTLPPRVKPKKDIFDEALEITKQCVEEQIKVNESAPPAPSAVLRLLAKECVGECDHLAYGACLSCIQALLQRCQRTKEVK